MGKLVTIVGNSGSGKTTLAKRLGEVGDYHVHLETHAERPFQAAFAQEKRYALPNQVDYLLYRAEQERTIRQAAGIGIQDGGLDLDFYVFTRLFHQRGYLNQDEFELCARLHQTLRNLLPPPNLIIYLHAPLEMIAQRKAMRQRELDVAVVADLETMEALLQRWMHHLDACQILPLESNREILSKEGIRQIITRIERE